MSDPVRVEITSLQPPGPGDVVVCKVPERLDRPAFESVAAALKDLFPDNRAAILQAGFDLAAVPKEYLDLRAIVRDFVAADQAHCEAAERDKRHWYTELWIDELWPIFERLRAAGRTLAAEPVYVSADRPVILDETPERMTRERFDELSRRLDVPTGAPSGSP